MLTRTLVLVLALAQAAPAAPTNDQLRAALATAIKALTDALALLPPAPPDIPPDIATDAALHAALEKGGTVTLKAGATYTGPFVMRTAGTVLKGNGATLTATGGPAIRIAASGVTVEQLTATATYTGGVIECGSNTATRWADQPTGVRIVDVSVPTHRGKRGIEVNCGVTIIRPNIRDVWSSALADSQAINVLNTCGPVTVEGPGELVAASENIMVGGDTLKLTDCPDKAPADLTFRNLTLTKPDTWRTDGVRRAVKNLFELKAGVRVRAENLVLAGSWGPNYGGVTFYGAQDGSAVVITPKNGQIIRDVVLDRLDVSRAASGLQLMGKDYNSVTPAPTTGVVVRNSIFRVTKTLGGRGVLALVVGGMQDATFEGVTALIDGSTLILCDTQTPVGPLTFRSSRLTTGPYGVMAPGVNFGGPAPAAYAQRPCVTQFEGNTIAGAPSAFRTNFPTNTYVTRAELDALIAPQ